MVSASQHALTNTSRISLIILASFATLIVSNVLAQLRITAQVAYQVHSYHLQDRVFLVAPLAAMAIVTPGHARPAIPLALHVQALSAHTALPVLASVTFTKYHA